MKAFFLLFVFAVIQAKTIQVGEYRCRRIFTLWCHNDKYLYLYNHNIKPQNISQSNTTHIIYRYSNTYTLDQFDKLHIYVLYYTSTRLANHTKSHVDGGRQRRVSTTTLFSFRTTELQQNIGTNRSSHDFGYKHCQKEKPFEKVKGSRKALFSEVCT